MEKYSINGVSLLKNEKAIFPMMGEFHFSRCPEPEWEEEIRKMRACGMDIIATYVFWIHHEEEEGVFDFTGQRNLHYFLELCERNGRCMCGFVLDRGHMEKHGMAVSGLAAEKRI